MKKIRLTVTTKSNLFIGGSPITFDIGGIDQYTITDFDQKPYIPGSSLKGTLRKIVHDLADEACTHSLTRIYEEYCGQLKAEAEKNLFKLNDAYRENSLNERMTTLEEKASAEYLFGIEGFNHTPKLLFSDLKLVDTKQQNIFSIDSKNTVKENEGNLSAIPRTYKTVAPNVIFQGEILFQNIQKLKKPEQFIQEAEKVLQECFELLNAGYYRLGNSGSRGYGRVEIQLEEQANGRS